MMNAWNRAVVTAVLALSLAGCAGSPQAAPVASTVTSTAAP